MSETTEKDKLVESVRGMYWLIRLSRIFPSPFENDCIQGFSI